MSADHGTRNRYHYGCRCADCTAANTAYYRERRRMQYARGLPDGDDRHGTYGGYTNWGCRCEACSAVHAETIARRYWAKKAALT